MHVGRAEQHPHFAGLVVVVLTVGFVEERKVVIIRHIGQRQIPAHVVSQVCRQSGQEVLVVAVNHPVLVPKVAGKSHAHTGVQKSAQYASTSSLRVAPAAVWGWLYITVVVPDAIMLRAV